MTKCLPTSQEYECKTYVWDNLLPSWFCNYVHHMYDQQLCGFLVYEHTPCVCYLLQNFPNLTTKVWNHNFFLQFTHEFGCRGTQQYIGFKSLVTTVTGVKIKVSELTVIFMPSIIQVYFDCLSKNGSSKCFTSSLSTSMFLSLFSDSLR